MIKINEEIKRKILETIFVIEDDENGDRERYKEIEFKFKNRIIFGNKMKKNVF
ncbi:hypothetical protein I7830_05370 [Mammaliicoccus sciuri]|uniref:hypothetical protein n=1 Tax=Mammaliicoccus sciuri TaxID=1296 RepID=UPI0018DE923F|nr:hypothetical protein [Mammaliicoccus sciuri]MEB7400175.1 hypothetical protein [Mammaliicoccus sciuri]QPW15700.1 hypothetical protein I7830_05370 [Mammaliicoccus sciuri]